MAICTNYHIGQSKVKQSKAIEENILLNGNSHWETKDGEIKWIWYSEVFKILIPFNDLMWYEYGLYEKMWH